jgi:hypothetical protein
MTFSRRAVGLIWALAAKLWVPLAYLAVAAGATWPAAVLGNSGIPGYAYADEGLFLWDYWMVGRWLWEGQPLWHSQMAFEPWGFFFFVNTHSFLYGLAAAFLAPILGLAAAYNLLLIASFAAASLTAHWLARELGFRQAGAFAAGLVFSFSAHRLAHVPGHPNLVAVETLPLAALGAVWLFRRGPTLKTWALLVLSALAAAYVDYYIAVYWAMVFGLAFVALSVSFPRRCWRLLANRRTWASGLLAGALGLAALWPIASSWVAIGREWKEKSSLSFYHSIDGVFLHTLWRPSHRLALWRWQPALSETLLRDRSHAIEQEGYLGWAATILVLIALACPPRGRRRSALQSHAFWTFALLIVLATGNRVFWSADMPLEWQGPGVFFGDLPVLKSLRAPGRLMMVAALPMGLLAGLGLERLLEAGRRRGKLASAGSLLAAGGLGLLFLAETLCVHPVSPIAGPTGLPLQALQRIREAPGEGTVLVSPLGGRAADPNLAQIFHGRHSYMLMIARMDQWVMSKLFARDLGWIRSPERFRPTHGPDVSPAWGWDGHASAERLRAAVQLHGIRWLVFPPYFRQEEMILYYAERLPVAWAERENGWGVMEIAPPDRLDRIVIASQNWPTSPADIDARIGNGEAPGFIVGREARFLVRLGREQEALARDPKILLSGFSLPPAPEGRRQQMRVFWDEELLTPEPIPLGPQSAAYRVELPAAQATAGWHWLTLEFPQALRPVDCLPDNKDKRVLGLWVEEIALELDFVWKRPAASEPLDPNIIALARDAWEPAEPMSPGAIGSGLSREFLEGKSARLMLHVSAEQAAQAEGAALVIAGFGLPPAPDGTAQQMRIRWDGQPINKMLLDISEQTVEWRLPLPEGQPSAGWHLIEMEFLRDSRPSERIPGNQDTRILPFYILKFDLELKPDQAGARK